jgi:AcrR family transcriptional regulator
MAVICHTGLVPAIKSVRERVRAEVISEITTEARRQLAVHGASGLSLRAVARELGMVSSGIYRYFAGRDELLTALIIETYDEVGRAAERAATDSIGAAPAARWLAIARAIRAWALANPHEYALVYGTPVPGYEAPRDTVDPAARSALAMIAVAVDAHRAGLLVPPADVPMPLTGAVHDDIATLCETEGIDLPVQVMARLLVGWTQLFGLISFELFGQTTNVITAHDDLFDNASVAIAHFIGLSPASP